MNYREMSAPELVKMWRKLVNDNVSIGRDSHLVKQALIEMNPVQMLLGIYQQTSKSISIPQFLRNKEQWLELDEGTAEIELAIAVTRHIPPEYYVYHENLDEESPMAHGRALEARLKLREWAENIIG